MTFPTVLAKLRYQLNDCSDEIYFIKICWRSRPEEVSFKKSRKCKNHGGINRTFSFGEEGIMHGVHDRPFELFSASLEYYYKESLIVYLPPPAPCFLPFSPPLATKLPISHLLPLPAIGFVLKDSSFASTQQDFRHMRHYWLLSVMCCLCFVLLYILSFFSDRTASHCRPLFPVVYLHQVKKGARLRQKPKSIPGMSFVSHQLKTLLSSLPSLVVKQGLA